METDFTGVPGKEDPGLRMRRLNTGGRQVPVWSVAGRNDVCAFYRWRGRQRRFMDCG